MDIQREKVNGRKAQTQQQCTADNQYGHADPGSIYTENPIKYQEGSKQERCEEVRQHNHCESGRDAGDSAHGTRVSSMCEK